MAMILWAELTKSKIHSIVAVQRSAVLGYPNWGSDICGYNQQLLEQEVCGRWLAFGALNPIMEVGPTRNVAFWNLPREPAYDVQLIALWRFYARLHQRLMDYSYAQAQEATRTGCRLCDRCFWLIRGPRKHGPTGGPIFTAVICSCLRFGRKGNANSKFIYRPDSVGATPGTRGRFTVEDRQSRWRLSRISCRCSFAWGRRLSLAI